MKSLALTITALSLCVTLLGCSGSVPTKPNSSYTNSNLIVCKNKHDKKEDFSYIEGSKKKYNPPEFPNITIFIMKDANGKTRHFNNLELENFICVPANR